jgi:hypothetical protein
MGNRFWIIPIEWILIWWGVQFCLIVSSIQILAHCWRSGTLELGWLAALILVWQGSKLWRCFHRRVQGG